MVTFETKVYENDWEYLLRNGFLKTMIERCNYSFQHKTLMINNVKNLKRVKYYADKAIDEKIIDNYYVVDDYVDEVLNHFEIDRASFKGGYYYSISELVSIYLCKDEYLLHFSSDSFLGLYSKDKWIIEALALMNEHPEIVVANPVWNNNFKEAESESFKILDKFYIGYGFSDQCYLIKTKVFQQQIYSETNIKSDRYPKYGGELFEKRVDAFMRNNGLKRITSKESTYFHINFGKNIYKRTLFRLLPRLHFYSRFGAI